MNLVTIPIIYTIIWVVTSIIAYYVIFSPTPCSTKEYKSDAKFEAIFYGMIWPLTIIIFLILLWKFRK